MKFQPKTILMMLVAMTTACLAGTRPETIPPDVPGRALRALPADICRIISAHQPPKE